jgi:hypothetical protein
MTPVVNFPTSTAGVVDTGGKLQIATGVMTSVANNGNNIRLLTPKSEIEEKYLSIFSHYYPKLSKQNN